MTSQTWRGIIVCVIALLLSAALSTPSAAQSIEPPAPFNPTDANGVNVLTGQFSVSTPTITIGPSGAGGLSYTRTWDTSVNNWHDNAVGMIQRGVYGTPGSGQQITNAYSVVVLGQTTTFIGASGVYTPAEGDNATLTRSGDIWTFTAADGSVAVFDKAIWTLNPYRASEGLITSLMRPNGEVLTFYYTEQLFHQPTVHTKRRLQSVTNNLGYQLHFQYGSNVADADWARVVAVRAINNAVEYCDPAANSCTLTHPWPTLTFGSATNQLTVTDSLNQTMRLVFSATTGALTGVRRPSSPSTNNITLTWGGISTPEVTALDNGDGTWAYALTRPPPFEPQGSVTATVTDPLNHATEVYSERLDEDISDPTSYPVWRVAMVTDALDGQTIYSYYPSNYRLAGVRQPEGNLIALSYDGRGNIAERSESAKTGSGLPDLVTVAAYPPTCANPRTCNQPESITDPRGYRTDFTYDATHGGVLTMTQPAPVGVAPVGSGTRPQTRYAYDDFSAWYKDSGGSIVQAASPVWRQIETSQCTTSASCDGQAEEVLTTTTYQAGSGSLASNVLPLSVSSGAGDASLTATVTTTWTALGDPATISDPLSNVTAYGYNAVGQRVGELAAGSGARPATLTSYDADGQVESVERGSATALTADGAFTGFSSPALESIASSYDAQGRKTRDTFSIGGVAQRVTQYSYDDASRLLCAAVRMNLASLPTDACALGTQGANGPDRIARNSYDALGRVTVLTSAYGTALAQATRTNAYTANGQIDWIEDANGNRSDYTYDGFDRLSRLTFPSPTTPHTPNTGDYEEYDYDANGNMIERRVRSGESIRFHYDNLNRQCFKDLPAHVTDPTVCGSDITGAGAADVFYAYDLLGRQLSARFASVSGDGVVYSYDALSRVLTETETWNSRTLTYAYDLAGNRTHLYYPDDNPNGARRYIQYTYDVLNRMDEVRENGATTTPGLLGVYAYDLLSRPTNLAFGNDTSAVLEYGETSQDWSYQQIFPDDTDSTLDVELTRNAAAQTLSRDFMATTSAYEWQPAPLNQSYTPNGLNQYTAVGGAAITNDARGNLTSDGSRTYSYDLENRLIEVSGATTLVLQYDPLGRLRTTAVSVGVTPTTFFYSGDQLMAEYNSATLTHRYAFGAGIDRPIVWYEGSAFSDPNWLHADELGSVIATSDIAGAATIYSYGPYGEPDAVNGWSGVRFRYTGQIMLTRPQIYFYKARMYDPRLGRFLQTDPIGYSAGSNLYAYVFNDPLNVTDPTGTVEVDVGPDIVVTARRPSRCDADCIGDWLVELFAQREEHEQEENTCPAEEAVEEAQFFRTLPRVLLEPPPVTPVTPKPSVPYPTDPLTPPGPGWQPRGPAGNWFNPRTGESLHPDLNHPPGIRPHWDYHLRGPNGGSWRWFPDGSLAPKAVPPIYQWQGEEPYIVTGCVR